MGTGKGSQVPEAHAPDCQCLLLCTPCMQHFHDKELHVVHHPQQVHSLFCSSTNTNQLSALQLLLS